MQNPMEEMVMGSIGVIDIVSLHKVMLILIEYHAWAWFPELPPP